MPLAWVAIQHGKGAEQGSVNVLDLATRTNTSFPINGRPGFLAETDEPGVLVVGFEHQLAYFDLATGAVGETIARIDTSPRAIINDGLAVEGGVVFGTKDLDCKLPVGALYFFDWATGEVRVLADKQTCSNGKVLMRDVEGATLIDIDSTPKRLHRYRLDRGLQRIVERSVVKPPHRLPAFPDGMRPSPDGESVVVAFYNGADLSDGLVQQIRLEDGAVLCEWIVPGSPRVTCPELVRMDGKVKLLLTTAVEGMPEAIRAHTPGAGCFYIAETML